MFINIIMISVIIRFERACLWKGAFPEQYIRMKREDTYTHKYEWEKSVSVHIRKLEIETSGCDREWREKKSSILHKTYQDGRMALGKEMGL